MLSVTRNTPVADSRVLVEAGEQTDPSPQDALDVASTDPVVAFAANNGLHPDVAKYADPNKGAHQPLPLEAKKDKALPNNPPPVVKCQTHANSFDLDTVTDADIKNLRACGENRLADTIVNAKASYADLLATKQIKIRVITSAGNGGQPVMVVTGPKFKPGADVHVHTHYHGDNATVADPLGSKAGVNARIRDTIAKDPQAMFVLPEAENTRPKRVDSPTDDLRYHVSWDNVSDQVQTVNDALTAAKVPQSAVTERVVSAHSGGGQAINKLINADPNGGTRLQADKLDLQDCLYHFRYWVDDKVVAGKKVPGHWVYPKEWETDTRLEMWSKTPNGKAVREVVFYSAGSDDGAGSRSKLLAKSFPPDARGNVRYRAVDMSKEPSMFDKKTRKIDPSVDPVAHDANNNTIPQKVLVRKQDDKPAVAHNYRPDLHYRTVGEHLGERLPKKKP
jgi:hypothetical protein